MDSTTLECSDNNTLWFVLMIVFIALFVVSLAINIFLWVIRHKNLLKIQQELQQQYQDQLRQSQTNVFYGGSKTTIL